MSDLGPSAFLVLGVVAQRGPITTYDLKAFVDTSIGYFWDFPRSQLYAQTDRLIGDGLLAASQEDGGRRRRELTITDAGRATLAAWLRQPAGAGTDIRDLGLLKLFFADELDGEEIGSLATEQLGHHRRQLATYEAIADAVGDGGPHPMNLRTLRMGLAFERMAIEFWASIAAEHDLA